MNCECMYYCKDASQDELLRLADVIKEFGKTHELYPAAISRIDEKCKSYYDYDSIWEQCGKSVNVPKDSLVLFVYGKYHYMTNKRIGGKTFKPLFPDSPVKFTDLVEYLVEY